MYLFIQRQALNKSSVNTIINSFKSSMNAGILLQLNVICKKTKKLLTYILIYKNYLTKLIFYVQGVCILNLQQFIGFTTYSSVIVRKLCYYGEANGLKLKETEKIIFLWKLLMLKVGVV